MESIIFENYKFKYPLNSENTLDGIDFSIKRGEFVTLIGKSGSGKSTLLKALKPQIRPSGEISGSVYVYGTDVNLMTQREQSEKIGFVMQNPDSQSVTDKVWHELAFGLESLGTPPDEIRSRVAEISSFFGINNWFRKDVAALSGGQKQILNLASAMVMRPEILVLDEPTSRLDPIASEEFINLLSKINRELSVTVILSEHRLEEAFAVSDRVLVLNDKKIVYSGSPRSAGDVLKGNIMFEALPSAVKVFSQIKNTPPYPLTVREAREELFKIASGRTFFVNKEEYKEKKVKAYLKNIHFGYEKGKDVLNGLSLNIREGEILAVLGSNGSGKTTLAKILCSSLKIQSGKVCLNGEKAAMLSQEPSEMFTKSTVLSELEATNANTEEIKKIAGLCLVGHLSDKNPYDLSGGEQQRAALAKVLLKSPSILVLDEPTKGLDPEGKKMLADILCSFKAEGKSAVIISHDIDFLARYSDRCAMLFDGSIISEAGSGEFFANNSFYTTSACKMSRDIINGAVIEEDILTALGINPSNPKYKITKYPDIAIKKEVKGKKSGIKKFFAVFLVLFSLLMLIFGNKADFSSPYAKLAVGFLPLILLTAAFSLFAKTEKLPSIKLNKKRKNPLRLILLILLTSLTLFAGLKIFDSKKYYAVSLIIIAETFVFSALSFEKSKPDARYLAVIAVLCALGAGSRVAFASLPQFKPVMAVVIISSIAFGGETGFLVGAVSGFVSNFFFGQGAWTPWQMFAFGTAGLISGIVANLKIIGKSRILLAIYGFIITPLIFGAIVNSSYVLMYHDSPAASMFAASFASALIFDLIHAMSTAFFLYICAPTLLSRLERIKVKYGFNT